jgi:DNA-binding transcriptional regulator YhcF (GntR family)
LLARKSLADEERTVNITIGDTASNGPVYDQIKQQITQAINSGELASGVSLPTPGTVAQQTGVDRGEVTRAYFELEQAGLVVTRRSKNFLGETTTHYNVR